MSQQTDVSGRSESAWIAVAAAQSGPWGIAAIGGAVVGVANLTLQLLSGHLTVAGPISVGLSVFFVIGAVGALLAGGRDRLRAWARAHPWRYSLVPAAGTGAAVLPVQFLLSAHGFFGSLFAAAWNAATVFLIVGLVGLVVRAVRAD